MARIWRCKETGKRIENNKCPGQGWVLVRRAGITKVKAKCPDCGAERVILESTKRGMNFNPQCMSCKRLALKIAKEQKDTFRPKRPCNKCEQIFQPVPGRLFLCERCADINQNPRNRLSIEPGWECFG